MFSYRHAYHAGNHADVLKHMTLIAIQQYLNQKNKPIQLIDTHAGIGMYDLQSDAANTSGEAAGGVLKVLEWAQEQNAEDVPEAIADYLKVIAHFNTDKDGKSTEQKYPGSPAILQHLRRQSDEVRDAFTAIEMHPKDQRMLTDYFDEIKKSRSITLTLGNGFTQLKGLLPPAASRAMVVIDPSYELKSDYRDVLTTVEDALTRFPTGVYCIWYPIIPRPEAHDLPKRLALLAQQHGRNWLNTSLSIGVDASNAYTPDIRMHRQKRADNYVGKTRYVAKAAEQHVGLRASGMLVINPPYTLRATLQDALPTLMQVLAQGEEGLGYTLDTHEA